MITRISIQHFRSIEYLNLELSDVSIFVGRNGAGKSNIIDAITFVRDALTDGLDKAVSDRHGIQSLRQWSPTRPFNVTITLSVRVPPNGVGYYAFTLAPLGDSYVIRREEGNWTDMRERVRQRRDREPEVHTVYIDRSFTRDEKGIVIIKDRDDDDKQTRVPDADDLFLSSRYSFGFGPLLAAASGFESYSIFPNTLREPQKQSKEIHLEKHGSNLASILKQMRKEKRSENITEIISSMQQVVPDLENITVQSIAGFLTPQFRIGSSDDQPTHVFNVNQMSDGTLRLLGILVALYQDPRPPTIALEEPELTVHPGILKIISDSITEVSQRCQILVTTHSPYLLDHFNPSKVFSVELADGMTQVKNLHKSQIKAVQEGLFSLGELMSVEGLHG